MKICTLKTLGKWFMYLALPFLSSITVAQTGGVIFYDDCEASNKPLFGGTNADISKAWNFKYTESNASIGRSSAYARKGSWSYKHTLSNPPQDTWEYLKAELCYNFSPAGVPSGHLGANNRAPSGIRWFAQSTLIPSSNNDYNTITNIGLTMKAWPDDYTTPSYLTMEQGRYYLFVTPVNSSMQAQAQRKFDCGPVVKDKWEDWVLHRNFTSRDSGYVELYKNGVLVASYYGGNWKDDANHAKEAYMVTGLYKWAFKSGWSPTPDVNYVEMYTDEFRVGLHSAKLEDFLIDRTTTPPPSNQLPTVNLGTNRTITLPTNSISITGTAADADGSISSFRWSQVSGPNTATITNGTTATATFSNLVQGTYSFRLTVTDNAGGTAAATVSVTVNPAPVDNVAPVANAGANRNITLPTNSTTLSGSGTDSDGTVTGFRWRQINGPNTANIVSATTAGTSVSGLIQGTYTFRLTVTDNDGATHSDDMNVTVNPAPNQAPTVSAGRNVTITLPTSSANLSGTATDSDGTIASYNWRQVNGPSTATIANAGNASTSVSGLIAGVYTFRLTATDNDGATATDDMTVTVNTAAPANEAPVANAGSNRTITLPTNSTTLAGSGTDSDGTITSYRWTQVSGPSTALINPVTAASTTVSSLVAGTYVFRLTVTDNAGATDADETTVVVNPAPVPNAAPTANAGSNRSITLPTNSTTLSGSGADTDGTITAYRWSQVSGPNTATIATTTAASTGVSNLVEGTYVFRLTVTDNDGARDADDVTVTVNPAPVAAVKRAPVSNAGGKKTVNTKSTSLDGSSSYDPDGTIVSYSWRQMNGPNTATFSSARSASTTVSNLATGTYSFQLEVTDNDGLKATSTMTLEVLPPPVAPVAKAANKTISLPTNRIELDGSGSTDSDGSIRSYRWSQQSGPATASILTPTGSKTVVGNLVAGTYQFQLEVTDNAGLKGTTTVSVRVLPNRAPVIVTSDSVEVLLPADTATLNASESYDPDGQIRLFQWKLVNGPSNAAMRNQNTSVLSLSGLVSGIYTFEILIRDNGNITVRKEVNVIVRGNSGKETLSMKLYPNPVASNGVLNLRLDDNSSGRGTVQFYSISGVLVQRDEINKQGTHFNKTYNISNFPAGTYVIRVQFDGMAPETRKFQKQ